MAFLQRELRSGLPGLLLCGIMAISSSSFSQSPDNSRTNQQDRAGVQPSADQQRTSPADQNLTRQIRRAIVTDKSLSTYAHNVKIISQDGQVTLRGPVRSDEEKRVVEAKATEIAGAGKVINDLQVAQKQQKQ